MQYVISDLHGRYDLFLKMLNKLKLKDTDTLYVLGDVFDRGPHPVKILLKMMEYPNIVPILGNHELMGMRCLRFLIEEVTDASLMRLDEEMVENLEQWSWNGNQPTIDEFHALDPEMREEVLDYVESFSTYEETTAGGYRYLLVHGGLGNFSPERPMWDYSLDELVWDRPDYEQMYFPDRYMVTGHTPTQYIDCNPRPGYIYQANHHIAIDCGAVFSGRLGAICLDNQEEIYVEDEFTWDQANFL